MFQNLIKLKQITIGEELCQETKINFSICTNLTEIDVRGNALEDKDFTHLSLLTRLTTDSSLLTPNFFQFVPNLVYFEFYGFFKEMKEEIKNRRKIKQRKRKKERKEKNNKQRKR